MTEFVEPVELTGRRWVRLEPLTRAHIPEIDAVAADGELGTLWYTMTPAPGGAEQWVERMLELRAADHFNFASRAAIERLGAKLDGVLRSHQVAADGSRRDTLMFRLDQLAG
jgi:hypothetical protein